MLCQMRESTLHQTMHVGVANYTQQIHLSHWPNDVLYDVMYEGNFPPFVAPNAISDGQKTSCQQECQFSCNYIDVTTQYLRFS